MRRIAPSGIAPSCYFRSSVEYPYRKALIQITERCNLYCAHCFVSAGDYGDAMSFQKIKDIVIPRLKKARVVSVSLTGGEPFDHPHLIDIVRLLRKADLRVGICTNATLITNEHMKTLKEIGEVHFNVSLDGFSAKSHGRFRGNQDSFDKTKETIKQLGDFGLLHGILVTPNNLAELQEYAEICDYAAKSNAEYVLMNPLSNMGRGVITIKKLRVSDAAMSEIEGMTSPYRKKLDIYNVRFPNKDLPLASCEAGNIIYVFVHGEVTVCPYLVFAASTPQSKHKATEFIVGNILTDEDIAERLDNYKFHKRYKVGDNPSCKSCSMNEACGKGCPAAVIARGEKIGALDAEICPVYATEAS